MEFEISPFIGYSTRKGKHGIIDIKFPQWNYSFIRLVMSRVRHCVSAEPHIEGKASGPNLQLCQDCALMSLPSARKAGRPSAGNTRNGPNANHEVSHDPR